MESVLCEHLSSSLFDSFKAGKFTSHPQNLTVPVGQTGVALTCSLNVIQAWVWSQRVGTVEVFTSNGGINLNNK